ncbi:hypothetical protein [Desulfovibrio ferrophilus]|uniref:Uncharacterized protein n=1 Tax=Desulfovibrio ferrophilus TaxID=241368 RepID=A0A2Z6AYL7_9BACT|nr:hypothetical protein [Desulfovibrio ferrophilus]BBD08352.1 uncharacterized protein DFE_1626 [Desulfovibrio ferrophilus]
MISKETFIAWLYEHGKITADLEFDIHDCFDAALDAATEALANMPGIGIMSSKRRLESFFAVCRYLDDKIEKGSLDPTEGMVALNILRVLSPAFRKAITEFDHQGPNTPPEQREALPQIARDYLDASRDLSAPLVAG